MIFIALLVILLSNSVFCQQGVFEPYTFTQYSCTGSYQWSSWFDTNDPNLTQGDLEITSHIQQLFPSFMCSAPIGIEAQTYYDTNPTTTGDIFRITVKDGFLCLNQQVTTYRNKLCSDYKVRYCCPITTVKH